MSLVVTISIGLLKLSTSLAVIVQTFGLSQYSHIARMSAAAPHNAVSCTRLYTVIGNGEKRNDVIFCGNRLVKPESNIVFFGGDVQDYSESMLAHRDNKRHEKWNLESTAKLLYRRFPNSHIWLIRPSKMHLKTFSIYGNFVESDAIGCPTHSGHYGSWHHLSKLLTSASKQINSTEERASSCNSLANENSCVPNGETFLSSPNLALSIIGFSKGCVVLNQFLHELKYAKEDPQLQGFIRRVSHMYWLDGGHNGGSKTWITDPEVLKSFLGTNIEARAHVTPYQVKDSMRKWIGQEHKKFVQNLRKLGVTVYDTIHFADEDRSIENHFKVLERF